MQTFLQLMFLEKMKWFEIIIYSLLMFQEKDFGVVNEARALPRSWKNPDALGKRVWFFPY